MRTREMLDGGESERGPLLCWLPKCLQYLLAAYDNCAAEGRALMAINYRLLWPLLGALLSLLLTVAESRLASNR